MGPCQQHLFPIGKVDLYQPEPEVEIGLETVPRTEDDDLDITLISERPTEEADTLDDIEIEFN